MPIFIGPRSPGPIYVSGCLKQTERGLWNFTDVTPADEDTNWILTDNDKKAFQGNVAMWLNLVANFGSDQETIWWPNLELIKGAPSGDEICNQFK